MINGKPFGLNIGYGFGNTTAASKNPVIYDGKAHKLDDVTFHFQKKDFLKPWKITSSDGRFEMDFKPIMDRVNEMDKKLLQAYNIRCLVIYPALLFWMMEQNFRLTDFCAELK